MKDHSPSTKFVILLADILGANNVFNYIIEHRASKGKHSITLELKNSFLYDHTPAISKVQELCLLMKYDFFEEEPTSKETRKFTFAFKTYKEIPPHGGESPSWIPYKKFQPKKETK
jgi:hypothetical protein